MPYQARVKGRHTSLAVICSDQERHECVAMASSVADVVHEHIKFMSKGSGGNSKFACRHCHKEFTGSQTRQLAHIAGQKGRGVAICEDIPDDKRDAINYQIERMQRIEQHSKGSSSGPGVRILLEQDTVQ